MEAGRVFVTGGSGFVGSAVIDELLTRGRAVTALANRGTLDDRGGRVRVVPGGLFDDRALDDAIAACDAVVHLVGIIMERPGRGVTFERIHFDGTRRVVDAARRHGVRRYVQMSALGVRPGAVSTYHKTKYRAEQYVCGSGLDWTIFRPSLIHGPKGEFMRMEAAWARRKAPPFFAMPYFGAGALGRGGAGRLQPVHVGDVARAFADALEKPRTIGEVYLLGGADRLTWPELHRACASAIVGRPRPVMALPAWYAKGLARVVPRLLLPFNRDQVIMSQEDNTCDLTKFRGDFGWDPQPFEPSLRAYVKQLLG
ncbi:MAG TPA: NAD(P)H-binding protein [Tepidisphaeraceae bacterium]|nr:NAD(P)H-binding protein [Tepidisphaeraceae bacterium]